MYVLGIGKRAFNNYEALKRIVRPFEATRKKSRQRLFLFRGPQHRQDFLVTKSVLRIGKQDMFQPCCIAMYYSRVPKEWGALENFRVFSTPPVRPYYESPLKRELRNY